MTHSTNSTDTTSWSTLPSSIIISFSVLNIILSITASLGNALILIALSKVSSIYPPTKWLFGCLAVTDLCVGLITQPLYVIYLLGRDYIDMDVILALSHASHFFFIVLFVISVLTSAAISVDRLLALLLRLRYRNVVTLRRVRVVIGCFWLLAVLNIALYTATRFFGIKTIHFLIGTFFGLIILSIVISTSCYTKIFFTLRHQQANLQELVQPGQMNGGRNPLNIARYKKTVWSIAWVQLALLFCYLPYTVMTLASRYGKIDSSNVTTVTRQLAVCLIYLNSSLNPILYCWRIEDVRQEVKNILRKCAPC